MGLNLNEPYELIVSRNAPQIFIQNGTAYYRDGRVMEGAEGARILNNNVAKKPIEVKADTLTPEAVADMAAGQDAAEPEEQEAPEEKPHKTKKGK